MTSLIPHNEPDPVSSTQVQPSSADPATAAAVKGAHSTTKEFSTSTTVNDISDLQSKAPEVYDKMMEGIAMSIIKDMRKHQEQLKKMMRDAENGR